MANAPIDSISNPDALPRPSPDSTPRIEHFDTEDPDVLAVVVSGLRTTSGRDLGVVVTLNTRSGKAGYTPFSGTYEAQEPVTSGERKALEVVANEALRDVQTRVILEMLGLRSHPCKKCGKCGRKFDADGNEVSGPLPQDD